MTVTDVYLGWTENLAIRNRAHSRVVAAIEEITDRLPYAMVGLDCDNGGESINHALVEGQRVAHHQGRTQHPDLRPAQDPLPAAHRLTVMADEQARRLAELHTATNPAELTRGTNRIQQALIGSSKDKTLALRDHAS